MRKSYDKKSRTTTFHWKWDKERFPNKTDAIQEEIRKSRKSIEGYSKYLDYWKWNYEKAKKEYESRVDKIKNLKEYIEVMTDAIKELESQTIPEEEVES